MNENANPPRTAVGSSDQRLVSALKSAYAACRYLSDGLGECIAGAQDGEATNDEKHKAEADEYIEWFESKFLTNAESSRAQTKTDHS